MTSGIHIYTLGLTQVQIWHNMRKIINAVYLKDIPKIWNRLIVAFMIPLCIRLGLDKLPCSKRLLSLMESTRKPYQILALTCILNVTNPNCKKHLESQYNEILHLYLLWWKFIFVVLWGFYASLHFGIHELNFRIMIIIIVVFVVVAVVVVWWRSCYILG